MAFSLEEINYRTVADPKGMIEEADEIYEQKIAKAARMILENRKKSPIVLLSGPSGSGKTTTAMKISRALEERGVRTHYVAMDDYFNTVRPETVPRTPEGEMDLESPLCLDMELLNSHFTELAQGKRIYVPKYEFSRQMRIQEPSKSIKLGLQALRFCQQRCDLPWGNCFSGKLVPARAPHGARLSVPRRGPESDDLHVGQCPPG